MLKVVSSRPSATVLVEIDPYVPLTIELGDEAGTPLYWRARADEGSLVEVGILPGDGSVHSITLTSISRERVIRSTDVDEDHFAHAGIPRLDTSLWPVNRREFADNFVEEVLPLNLILGASTATLYFSRSSVPTSWQGTDSVLFGVAEDGSLCCIEVRNLSSEQLETIAGAVND